MKNKQHLFTKYSCLTLLATGLLSPATVLAVDGVIEINQARALAGGVTPGDTPGFPVTLSQGGSYRLTGNLATSSKEVTAILITANDVTVDLNGFTIACTFFTGAQPVGCQPTSGSGSGVEVDNTRHQRTTVKNGVIRGMGRDGVIVGDHSQIADLHVADNGRNGIFALSYSIITGNTASSNGNDGIQGLGNITGNTVSSNGNEGIQGFGNITGNTAALNGRIGILAVEGSTVIGNTASNNDGVGLFMGGSSPAGYKDNVLTQNNGGNANAQVNGGIEIGTNICGDDTICP